MGSFQDLGTRMAWRLSLQRVNEKSLTFMNLRQALANPSGTRSALVFSATKMSAPKRASLMCYLGEIDGPCKPSNGTLHDFVEILVIAMAAMLSDCDTV
jgi:hypothetical protein